MDTEVFRKLHSNRSKTIFVGGYFQPWINTNLVLYWVFLAAELHMFMVIRHNVAHWSVCNILLDTDEASWLRENKLHKAWIHGQDFLVGSILCWFWRFVDDTQACPLVEQKAILEIDSWSEKLSSAADTLGQAATKSKCRYLTTWEWHSTINYTRNSNMKMYCDKAKEEPVAYIGRRSPSRP